MVDGTGKTAGTTPEGRGAARRPMWVVVLLLVLAAGALWGSSRLAWTALVEERPGGAVTVALREGDEHSPALVPLALLALAGIAAVVATGGWVRRVLGALLAVIAASVLWLTVFQAGFQAGFQADEGHGSAARLSPQQAEKVRSAEAQRPWALALAGVGAGAVVVAGVVLVLRGHRMPRMGEKYRAPSAGAPPMDPQRRMWDALDAGEDPTNGPRDQAD